MCAAPTSPSAPPASPPLSGPRLTAPSQIVSGGRYNKSVDWYALGVLIFEMLTGLPPFYEPGLSLLVLYDKILRGPACIAWPADASPEAAEIGRAKV